MTHAELKQCVAQTSCDCRKVQNNLCYSCRVFKLYDKLVEDQQQKIAELEKRIINRVNPYLGSVPGWSND